LTNQDIRKVQKETVFSYKKEQGKGKGMKEHSNQSRVKRIRVHKIFRKPHGCKVERRAGYSDSLPFLSS
jgi:hypothetical protein